MMGVSPTTAKLWAARACADTLPGPYGGWESAEGEMGYSINTDPALLVLHSLRRSHKTSFFC